MATINISAAKDKPQLIQYMTKQTRRLVHMGIKSRHWGRFPRPEDGEYEKNVLKELDKYLEWLDTVKMTPEIMVETGIEKTINFMLSSSTIHYPEGIKQAVRTLREKWECESWGTTAVNDEDVIPEGRQDVAQEVETTTDEDSTSLDQESSNSISDVVSSTDEEPPSPGQSSDPGPGNAILSDYECEEKEYTPIRDKASIIKSDIPPPNHPIFGKRGIMYGITILRSAAGRKTYRLNPQVPKKSAKVFGHNNIPVGFWFANQLVALQRGAHGSRGGGIAGTGSTGAFSIVVADMYEDLDRDQGETLYYSGSNSHKNVDRNKPAPSSIGTRALKTSLRAQTPVRVLRAGAGSSRCNQWLPECGLRYDGLYNVMALRERKNRRGGLYEQFELVRIRGQKPLEELLETSPTAQQKRDLYSIQRGCL